MNHKRTISSKFYTCKEVKKLVLSGYYICLLVMIKGFYKNTAKSAALLGVCIFCMLFTASCGKKDKSIFISSNDQYNKKFKKKENSRRSLVHFKQRITFRKIYSKPKEGEVINSIVVYNKITYFFCNYHILVRFLQNDF